jgi:hypothetical protein
VSERLTVLAAGERIKGGSKRLRLQGVVRIPKAVHLIQPSVSFLDWAFKSTPIMATGAHQPPVPPQGAPCWIEICSTDPPKLKVVQLLGSGVEC